MIYIGEDLFMNYYVVMDYDNQRVGMAGYVTDIEKDKSMFPLWAIILLAVVGVIVVGGGLAFYCIRKR